MGSACGVYGGPPDTYDPNEAEPVSGDEEVAEDGDAAEDEPGHAAEDEAGGSGP